MEAGYIELPLSRKYKKKLESYSCRPRIKIPENIWDNKIIHVEIIPINDGKKCLKPISLIKLKKNHGLDKDKFMGIDLGVNNFATIVTSEGTP